MENKNKFDVEKETNGIKIVFSSTMDNIDGADEETRRFLKEVGLETEIFSVCLVMREALTNGVRHGNRSDSNKMINYSLKIQNNALIMEIEDEGNGFDWRGVREKLLDIFLSQSFIMDLEDQGENADLNAVRERHPAPESDHGRGLIIMSHYFTDYTYNDKGNKLVLTKQL